MPETNITQPANSQFPLRPPVVAVLGHVDHGKTTLLDFIRKSHVAEKEAGGITQHIGAYQVTVKTTQEQNKITFIDTPGHEAFDKMRSRGTNAADIAILVVAASEGVKPQTEEAVEHIKKANIPVIVAATKIDLEQANVERTKQQLAKLGILVESFGGEVVLVPVSAKTGEGIEQLLDAILLISAMRELKADPKAAFEGVIIEARLDRQRGPLATVLVKSGTLKKSEIIFAETIEAKVRSMVDSAGQEVDQAYPSQPVEVIGWKSVPEIGAPVTSKFIPKNIARSVVVPKPFSLPAISTVKKLKLIIKADTKGTLEAVVAGLPKEKLDIVQSNIGDISESDIMLAKSTNSAVIGFGVKIPPKSELLAKTEKIRIKVYKVIYEMLEEISEVVELLNKPEAAQIELGSGSILDIFNAKEGKVAGCKIESGKFSRGNQAKIIRKENIIGKAVIKSIRQGKADVPSVELGQECGLIFDKKLDFAIGDRIIAFKSKDLLA